MSPVLDPASCSQDRNDPLFREPQLPLLRLQGDRFYSYLGEFQGLRSPRLRHLRPLQVTDFTHFWRKIRGPGQMIIEKYESAFRVVLDMPAVLRNKSSKLANVACNTKLNERLEIANAFTQGARRLK